MYLKFIILALFFTISTGEEGVSHQSAGSGLAKPVQKLSIDSIRTIYGQTDKTDVPKTDTTPASTTSTTPASTTSTTPATTTTTTPKSTTTTTPATTTTTTPATTTTTTPATTTTTTPAPPIKEVGIWNVTGAINGSLCVLVEMELEFNITYPGNKSIIRNTTLYVPKNASANGSCSDTVQNITLKWDNGNSFEMNFERNKTTEKFQITLFKLIVNTVGFEDIADNVKNLTFISNKTDFPAIPVKMSYRCDKQIKQVMNSTYGDQYSATLFATHTQLEAFMSKKNAVFSEAKDCDGLDTPDIVPIVVGCVLVVLVVVVLGAYLIGRRRSQSRGYLSM